MRWTLRITVALGAAFLALTAVFLLSLVAVPVLPRTLGLSEPVRRALRPHLPVPPTRASRLSIFLIQRERRQLLRQLARDQQDTLRRALIGSAKVRPPIVAAFYATWQETGLHSLRANADRSAQLFSLWLRAPRAGAGPPHPAQDRNQTPPSLPTRTRPTKPPPPYRHARLEPRVH